jgi:hypothetical protein
MQGPDRLPNGLLGVCLTDSAEHFLAWEPPPRLEINTAADESQAYAQYRMMPSPQQLKDWIEDAYEARTTRAHLIKNPRDRFEYNRLCKYHNETHPA